MAKKLGYPKEVVTTPFGPLTIWAQDGDVIAFATEGAVNVSDPPPQLLTINRVEYRVRVHLDARPDAKKYFTAHDDVDGWRITYCSLDRARSNKIDDYSWAALDKVRDVVVPFMVTWVRAHPSFLKAACAYGNQRARENLNEEIRETEAKLKELHRKLAAL